MKTTNQQTPNESYKRLVDGNRKYALSKKFDDPQYFKKLAMSQSPEYLWIGCSDSRVPANEVTGTQAGDIFVHRNVANLVVHTDLNLLSVLEYAVEILQVKQVIVCGHYGCGGVRFAMSNKTLGFVDNWLCQIKEIYSRHEIELSRIADFDKRADRLTELNVMEQVRNLAKTKIIQRAWKERSLQVHGWVYGLDSGFIKELNTIYEEAGDMEPIYRYAL